MTEDNVKQGLYNQQVTVTNISAGNYSAQGQLDFRLAHSGTLRIISSSNRGQESTEERDFQIAMKRRKEREGATLADVGKKYGL